LFLMKKLFYIVALFLCTQLTAESFQVVKDGPIHEAFVQQEFGNLIQEAVPNEPPQKITELIPEQTDSQSIWIPGYWAWSKKHGIYLWISGIWRRPPPGRQWISGYWKNYPDGWVWVQGFWSKAYADSVYDLEFFPPDPIDELIPKPPEPATNYFWVPGYWEFDSKNYQFVWNSGRWELFSTHWIYFPAQYIWREKGYVFNPGFWDWPVKIRGLAFAAIDIEQDALDVIVYEPKESLEELQIMELYFPYWPSYSCLYRYHFYFYSDAWIAWGAIPPWWNWPTWWCYPWQDQWWLWWWWCKPGYPNPPWMTSELAQAITTPPKFVVHFMDHTQPPLFVTPYGVVGGKKIFKALSIISGKDLPILPSDPKQVLQIQDVANPEGKKVSSLEPSGKRDSKEIPAKPFFGPTPHSLKAAPRRVTVPKKPQLTAPGDLSYNVPQDIFWLLQQPQPYGTYAPQPRPRYRAPVQGYDLNYTYPPHSLHSQHRDHLMTHPQPQVNPAGPKAHQVPGDHSTLPGL
jgi:hypothetical protein